MSKPSQPGPGGRTGADAGDALLFVDAIEGQFARLLFGQQVFDFPVRLLPEHAKEGSWLRLSLAIAPDPPDEAAAVRHRLDRDDDGGDIKL